MCRLGFGLALLVMAVAANAAEWENGVFFRQPDLLTVHIAQFDFGGLARAQPYRLSLSIVPIYSAVNVTFGSGLNHTSQLPPVTESRNAWATTNNWGQFFDKDHPSSLPLLRLESKGERFEIKPRRHSVSIQWSKTFQ